MSGYLKSEYAGEKKMEKLPVPPNEPPISPTRCARELDKSQQTIFSLIESNEDRLVVQYVGDSQRRVYLSQVKYCLENPRKYVDENYDEMDGDSYEHIMDDPEMETVPKKARYLYIVKRGTKVIEKLGFQPTEEHITNLIGPGTYRIDKYDQVQGVIVDSDVMEITDGDGYSQTSALNEAIQALNNFSELQSKIVGNEKGNGSRLAEIMIQQTTELNKTLLTLLLQKEQPRDGFESFFEKFSLLKEMGLFQSNDGRNVYDILNTGVEKIGNFLDSMAPLIQQRAGLPPIDPDDLDGVPKLDELVPAVEPVTVEQAPAHVQTQGGGDIEIQTLEAIDDAQQGQPGEGEKV